MPRTRGIAVWLGSNRQSSHLRPPNPDSFSTWIAWVERRLCRKERPLVVNAAPSGLAVTPSPPTHSGQQNKSYCSQRAVQAAFL